MKELDVLDLIDLIKENKERITVHIDDYFFDLKDLSKKSKTKIPSNPPFVKYFSLYDKNSGINIITIRFYVGIKKEKITPGDLINMFFEKKDFNGKQLAYININFKIIKRINEKTFLVKFMDKLLKVEKDYTKSLFEFPGNILEVNFSCLYLKDYGISGLPLKKMKGKGNFYLLDDFDIVKELI